MLAHPEVIWMISIREYPQLLRAADRERLATFAQASAQASRPVTGDAPRHARAWLARMPPRLRGAPRPVQPATAWK